MSTTFGIEVKGQTVEVARRSSAGNGNSKLHINIINPLLWLVPINTNVDALDNQSQGIETVLDIIRYVDNKFDDGFRPVGNRAIGSNDKCIKCGYTFIEHKKSYKCPLKHELV